MSKKLIKVKEVSSILIKSLPAIAGFNCVIKCSQIIDKNGVSVVCVVVFNNTTAETHIRYFEEELEAALFIERWV